MHLKAWIVLSIVFLSSQTATGIGFDRDDYIIAAFSSGNIGVFDSDFSFKGYLDSNFPNVAGLDFDASGNVVAAGINSEVRVYDTAGTHLRTLNAGSTEQIQPIDLKVGPNGNYYIGCQNGLLREMSPTGDLLRVFNSPDAQGVAVLPGNKLWVGPGFEAPTPRYIDIYDISTGNSLGSIPLSGVQRDVSSMFYSPLTNSVLVAQSYSTSEGVLLNHVFERATDGTLIRIFRSTDKPLQPLGVTRGPANDVLITDERYNTVNFWNASGSWMGEVSIAPLRVPINILWAGNAIVVPEPSSLLLFAVCAISILGYRTAKVRRS